MEGIDHYIWTRVIGHLDHPRDLGHCSRVCRDWSKICSVSPAWLKIEKNWLISFAVSFNADVTILVDFMQPIVIAIPTRKARVLTEEQKKAGWYNILYDEKYKYFWEDSNGFEDPKIRVLEKKKFNSLLWKE